ncbi:MAG: hypothetical protein AAFU03_12090, partial [Bacteroidota bacterium]
QGPTLDFTYEVDPPTNSESSDGSIQCMWEGSAESLLFILTGPNGETSNQTGEFNDLSVGDYTLRLVINENTNCFEEYTFTISTEDSGAPTLTVVASSNPSQCGLNDGWIRVAAPNDGETYVYSQFSEGPYDTTSFFTGLPGEAVTTIYVRNVNCEQVSCIGEVSIQLTDPDPVQFSVETLQEPSGCGSANGIIGIELLGTANDLQLTLFDEAGNEQNGNLEELMFTSLAPGEYTIRLRTNNTATCEVSTTIQLAGGTTLPTVGIENIEPPSQCGEGDGMIILDPIAGANYEYSLNIGGPYSNATVISGLEAGPVTIYIRPENAVGTDCIGQVETVVPPGAAIDFEYTPQPPSACGLQDGFIAMTVEGNPPNVTYYLIDQENNTFTSPNGFFEGLGNGSYILRLVTTSEENCFSEEQVTLNAVGTPTFSIDTIVAPSECGLANGEIVIEPPAGGGIYQFRLTTEGSWTTSTTITAPSGTYRLFIRPLSIDSLDCVGNIEVIIPDAADFSFTPEILTEPSVCDPDGVISFGTISPPLTDPIYQIFSEDGTQLITEQSTPVFNNLPGGTYLLRVIANDAPECAANQLLTIGETTGQAQVPDIFTSNVNSCL